MTFRKDAICVLAFFWSPVARLDSDWFRYKTVQFGWPLGMPVVDHVDRDIWEVRTRLANRMARVLFVLEGNEMILLHGYIKYARSQWEIVKSTRYEDARCVSCTTVHSRSLPSYAKITHALITDW